MDIISNLFLIIGLTLYIAAVSDAAACAKSRGLRPAFLIWLAAVPLWFVNQAIADSIHRDLKDSFLGILFYHSYLFQSLIVCLLTLFLFHFRIGSLGRASDSSEQAHSVTQQSKKPAAEKTATSDSAQSSQDGLLKAEAATNTKDLSPTNQNGQAKAVAGVPPKSNQGRSAFGRGSIGLILGGIAGIVGTIVGSFIFLSQTTTAGGDLRPFMLIIVFGGLATVVFMLIGLIIGSLSSLSSGQSSGRKFIEILDSDSMPNRTAGWHTARKWTVILGVLLLAFVFVRISLSPGRNGSRAEPHAAQWQSSRPNQNSSVASYTGKIPTLPLTLFTNSILPTNGLVAWLPFNKTVLDESGNQRHATNHGARFVPDRFGVDGGALRFDGKQHVDCGTNRIFELGQQGTLACWMLSFQPSGPLIGKDPLQYHGDVQLGINPHNKARGLITMAMSPKEGGLIHLATEPQITPGKWYHVLGQWDTNGFRLFVDGKRVAEKSGAHKVHASGRPLLIGRFQADHFFHGIIDDVAIYDRALNSSEVEKLHRYSELAGWQRQLAQKGLGEVNQLPTKLQRALKGRATKDGQGNISLDFRDSKIDDLSGVNGLPLTRLNLDGTGVADLTPLKGLRLRELKLSGTQVTNLQALSEMPLNVLFVASPVVDLEPLRHCPLENLWIVSKKLADIGALSGMKLKHAWIASDSLADISPLQGLPLEELRLSECPAISDLSPLMNCRQLKRLMVHPNVGKKVETLRDHPSLTHLLYRYPANGWQKAQGVEQFWKEYDSKGGK